MEKSAEAGNGEIPARENLQHTECKLSSAPVTDCTICLEPYELPVEIPCGHVFCFLCIKGVCSRYSRCPICRRDVPADYFHQPKLIEDSNQSPPSEIIPCPDVSTRPLDHLSTASTSENKESDTLSTCPLSSSKWYYEGRNGWWMYDKRTSVYLEDAYKNDPNSTSLEAMISGYIYVIDLNQMIQYRKDEPARRRRIRREVVDEVEDVVKGIAGLKMPIQNGSPN